MKLHAYSALLLLLAACATPVPKSRLRVSRDPKAANLHRAAALPWRDEGRCAVGEASQPWPVLVERCFHTLDHDRIRFNDAAGRCAVASTGTAALGVGLCVLAAPEIVVGAVIIAGVVVVGLAIKEALDAYELKGSRSEEEEPVRQAEVATQRASKERHPKPNPSGRDWLPPVPSEPSDRERRPECIPKRIAPKGGNALHNKCADNVPFNGYRGANALVNGKAFDALQVVAGALWEVKTDNFDAYPLEFQAVIVRKQAKELRRERELAAACGFDFRVGVRSAVHKSMLEFEDNTLSVVVMDWC
jgi:hypothetical protein